MHSYIHAFILVFIFFYSINLPAQPSFVRADTVKVKSGTTWLKNPWAGGINFAQLSSIDLNLDGIKDLFVFDRSGNKILTFINNGISDSVSYSYAPEYESKFPPLHDWALLADYNCDGKEDIFSYTNAGFCVWKNTSDLLNGLQFTLDTPNMYLNYYWRVASDFGSGTYNLYISSIDIPAISDIDGDGDLDILTFGVNGTTVEYHKNKSVELFGSCDSLKYALVTPCWGNFYENALDNTVVYPVTCKGPASIPPPFDYTGNSVHSGSTLLAFDIDCDNDKELLLGDITFGNMVLVINGGDSSAASVVAHDYNFPSGTTSVDLHLFPAGFYLDINNDNLNDLVVSPNARNVSENFTSVWFYENIGTSCAPQFIFKKNNLLQDEMLDFGEGAYPLFFDFDADGKTDILVGNYGYYSQTGNFISKIAALKNTGSSVNPEFELISTDYAGIESLGLSGVYPAFGDLDNDGDDDMLIGIREGSIVYMENTAGAGNPADFQFAQADYQGIDVGWFAAPQLIDLDKDGLLDLVIGEQSGNLNFYKNTGTASNPVFTYVTDSLGKVKTSTQMAYFGFSVPFFYDDNGDYRLICGTENGGLWYYEDIDGNLMGAFTLASTFLGSVVPGIRSSLNGADINNDGLLDFIVGNYRGGISLYLGDTTLVTGNTPGPEPALILIYPNPASDKITIVTTGQLYNNYLQISISDITGRKVKEFTFQPVFNNQKKNIVSTEVKNLNPGLYFCTVRSQELLYHTRFVVMR